MIKFSMKTPASMKEHGSFTFESKGQLIISRAFDAWNKETAQNMCNQMYILANKINDKPWGILVDLRQWEFGPPDMWEPIEDFNRWANDNNQKFEAVICGLNIQRMLLKQSQEVFSDVKSEFFENEEKALKWLEENGIK